MLSYFIELLIILLLLNQFRFTLFSVFLHYTRKQIIGSTPASMRFYPHNYSLLLHRNITVVKMLECTTIMMEYF